MAQSKSENFPVALRLLSSRLRERLLAVYGYARLVDDLGDEYEGDRVAALAWAEEQINVLYDYLNRSVADTPAGHPIAQLSSESPRRRQITPKGGTLAAANVPTLHPVFRRLAPVVAHCGIDRAPLDALLAANRLDQSKTRYATWDDLMGYCSLSASPVGHLTLAVLEADTPAHRAASDSVCSALQVIEHVVDIAEDYAAGRVYVPQEVLAVFDCSDAELAAPAAAPALVSVVAYMTGRARELMAPGQDLVGTLRGFARLSVAGFVAGGLATLESIEAARFDVLSSKVRRCKFRTAVLLALVYMRGVIDSFIKAFASHPPNLRREKK